jgi:ribosomal protein S18 acetylase RimI-like enzyme
MGLREPTTEDAMALGELHVAAWRAAYRNGLMPDDYLDGLDVEERALHWAQVLTGPRPATSAYLVAQDADDRIVGFITVGAERDDEGASRGEVYALNIHPRAWGDGYGQALLAAGTRALAAAGFTRADLWVHPDNDRARRFYERNGWQPTDEERTQEVHGVEVAEVRYERSLSVDHA